MRFLTYGGNRDLRQVFSEPPTYVVLAFGTFFLLFIYFLAGWDAIVESFYWAMEGDDDNGLLLFFGPVFGFLGGLILLVLGFHEYGEYSLIRNTPTSTVRSVPMGRVEVKGESAFLGGEDELRSPFAKEPCVGYECRVEEYQPDDDGSDWVTVYSDRVTVPFLLEDETGQLVVDARNAEWNLDGNEYYRKYQEDEAPAHIRTFIEEEIDSEKWLDVDLLGGDTMRFTEDRIPLAEELYVLGAARSFDNYEGLETDDVDVVLARDENTGMFYLSDSPEEEIIESKRWGVLGLLTSGTLLTPASGVGLLFLLGIL